MALESSPFSRKTTEKVSAETRELARAEKPEELDVYGLPTTVKESPAALTRAVTAYAEGWEQYARDRNYTEAGGNGPLKELAAKRDEAVILANTLRDLHRNYIADKAQAQAQATFNENAAPTPRGYDLSDEERAELSNKKEDRSLWENYTKETEAIDKSLTALLKEMNGPLARAVEEAVSDAEAYMYKVDKTPEAVREDLAQTIEEVVEITGTGSVSEIPATVVEAASETAAEEKTRRIREEVIPAAEQKYDEKLKKGGFFAPLTGWLSKHAEGTKSGIGKKLAFLGAFGGIVTAMFGTYDNAPRRTEKVTKVEAKSTAPEPTVTIRQSAASVEAPKEAVVPKPRKRASSKRATSAVQEVTAASTAEYVSPIKNVVQLPEGMDPNSPEATAFLNRAYNPEVFAESEQSAT